MECNDEEVGVGEYYIEDDADDEQRSLDVLEESWLEQETLSNSYDGELKN